MLDNCISHHVSNGERTMKEYEITTRLRRLKEIAHKTTDLNVHNIAMNQIVILEIMYDRWIEGFNSNSGFYDEETDFYKAYQNIIEELEELEKERISDKKMICKRCHQPKLRRVLHVEEILKGLCVKCWIIESVKG